MVVQEAATRLGLGLPSSGGVSDDDSQQGAVLESLLMLIDQAS